MQELTKMIEAQQKGHKEDEIFMIGEQLKEMAAVNPNFVEILKQDLRMEAMSLQGAARALKAYSDKNHGDRNCFVITPDRAEAILCEFYGLQVPKRPLSTTHSHPQAMIDLEAFL